MNLGWTIVNILRNEVNRLCASTERRCFSIQSVFSAVTKYLLRSERIQGDSLGPADVFQSGSLYSDFFFGFIFRYFRIRFLIHWRFPEGPGSHPSSRRSSKGERAFDSKGP